MLRLRALFAAGLVASSTTACTLLVIGALDDEKTPMEAGTGTSSGTSGGTSGTSGTSGEPKQAEPCSLLAPNTYGGTELPHNTCSDCIYDKCAASVAESCDPNGDRGAWYERMKKCAQNPWQGQPPPGPNANYNEWGCSSYDHTVSVINGDSDDAKDHRAANCIKTNCVKEPGKPTPCRLCEVSLKVGNDSFLLKDDPCGHCFVDNCKQTIVDCCMTPAIDEFVSYCAHTDDPDNIPKCAYIADASDLATFSQSKSYYGDAGFQCAQQLAQCWLDHCKDEEPKCHPR